MRPATLRVVLLLSLLSFVVVGCGETSSADPETPAATTTTTEERDLPEGVTDAAIRAACAGPCIGEFSGVEVWRDAAGAVGRLIAVAGPGQCSHAPTLIYDAAGAELARVADVPFDPENPTAVAARETYTEHTTPFTRAERVRCTP